MSQPLEEYQEDGQKRASLVQALKDGKIIDDPAGLGRIQRLLPGAIVRVLGAFERPSQGASLLDRVTS